MKDPIVIVARANGPITMPGDLPSRPRIQMGKLEYQPQFAAIHESKMEEAVLELRAGDGLTDVLAVTVLVIFFNWYDSRFGTEAAFQSTNLPHQNIVNWFNDKYNSRGQNAGSSSSKPMTGLTMQKPASMPQPEYSALTKSEKRQLADPEGRDGVIEISGYPRLDLRFNQVEFKTPAHGGVHGLPTDDNGKTPKSEAIAMRDSLIDMPNRPGLVWYTDGQYQGGTPRGCDTINLYDPARRLIAVYQKQPDGTNLFLTTCQ